MPLILASSSPYRKELLSRLGLAFSCISPKIDERAHTQERPLDLVERLAVEKAKAVAQQYTDSLIIGADQVAVLDNEIIGKPEDHDAAVKQLIDASDREIKLYTGLCLYNAQTGNLQHCVEPYSVKFRKLNLDQIERYLKKDQPYNCAGSLKSESLGIALLKKLKGDDPNTLIGLPMIRLIDMLHNEGIDPVLA